MNNLVCFFVISLVFFLMPSFLSANIDTLCHNEEKDTIVFYVNGIDADIYKANDAVAGLKLAYENRLSKFSDYNFYFDISENPTSDFYKDLIKSFTQKTIEMGGLTPKEVFALANESKETVSLALDMMGKKKKIKLELAKEAVEIASGLLLDHLEEVSIKSTSYVLRTESIHYHRYLTALNAGKRVILVAHGQGSVYANNVVNKIISDHPYYKKNIGIIGAANFANKDKMIERFEYVTANDDEAFLAMNLFAPYDLPSSNTKNDLGYSDDHRDRYNHYFLQSYLGSRLIPEYKKAYLDNKSYELPSRKKIDDYIDKFAEKLSFPIKDNEEPVIKIVMDFYGYHYGTQFLDVGEYLGFTEGLLKDTRQTFEIYCRNLYEGIIPLTLRTYIGSDGARDFTGGFSYITIEIGSFRKKYFFDMRDGHQNYYFDRGLLFKEQKKNILSIDLERGILGYDYVISDNSALQEVSINTIQPPIDLGY